jgi:AcrR family transcriptional regulator
MSRDRAPAGSGADVAPRGRPRSVGADRAILESTFRQLVDVGYAGLSVEAVATDAGVAKTTIYRRYPGKRDLVIAALSRETPFTPPPSDLPSREALERFVHGAIGSLVESGAIRILGSLLVEEQREPGILEVFRARIIAPRRALVEDMLRRGIARGEIRPDVDPLVVAELVAGAILGHHAILGLTGSDDWVSRLVDHVWAAVEARPPR